MPNDISNATWSEADASNTSSPPNGAPTGFAPNQTEAIFRQMMGATKRFWDRIDGTVTTTGSAGAYVYTPANTSYPTAYVQGETFRAIANFTSVGNDTLNVNSLGALKLYKPGSSGPTALAAGDIQNTEMFAASYDSALNSGAGGFHVQSGISPASGGVTSIADATNGGLNFSASTGAVTAKLQPSDLATKASPTTSDSVVIMDAAASNAGKTCTIPQLFSAFTSVAQIVNTETGAVATGTTTYTQNDSIPTNTNGDQYMSLSITPTNSSSTLVIDVIFIGSVNSAGVLWVGLFQDTTSSALASALTDITTAGNYRIITLRHKMTAGTTSATTFKARAGLNGAATTTFNGLSGSRQLGGNLASSITITEYLP